MFLVSGYIVIEVKCIGTVFKNSALLCVPHFVFVTKTKDLCCLGKQRFLIARVMHTTQIQCVV